MTSPSPSDRRTLGFLGLGAMGSGMAARLVDAGHDVVVWNRSSEPVEALVARGARAASDPLEALQAEVSFAMLANDEATEAVLTAERIAALGGRTLVMTASISPALAERLASAFARAGAHYVAAPVLGRPDVAAAGQLNVLAAGSGPVVDALEPLLQTLGKRVWRLGERPEIANAVKAVVNYNIIHAMQAIGESVAMTERLGIAPEVLTDLLSQTLFGGVVYTNYGRIIARQEYTPAGFHIALGRKDLGLAAEVAASVGVTAATMPALVEVFDTALADPELREADWSAIAEVSRRDLG
ncbi:NAD(P)-dependent oxidoreductase [Microbacterium sp. RD1]|uniref:NAD(P)-dependent oxidoreductase n=1 Tax=Microbacterium sp. RD1 TaxID=3457313 RepID=UPI003FA5F511